MMKKLHQPCAVCAILLTALYLSACGWASGGDTPVATEPNPAPTLNRGSQVKLTPTLDSTSNVDLEAVLWIPPTLPNGDAVKLKFTLINRSEDSLYLLNWFTPFEGLGGEIFCVARDGQPIPYAGPLAARGDPTADAYVFLDAGASVSATVDLATAYDFSEPGEYTIACISPRNSHVARSESEMVTSVDDLGPVQLPSNQVILKIGGS